MIALFIVIHLLLLALTQFTLWPEMVVYPYLLNNGFLLYRDIINPYPPTLVYILSPLTAIFGYQPEGFKFLTWGLIVLTDLLVYKISSVLFSKKIALWALAFFLFISIPFGINGLWFELVQTTPILAGVLFLCKYLKNNKIFQLFLSFLSFCFAFFVKQQIVWLAPILIAIVLVKNRNNIKELFKKTWYLPLLIISHLFAESLFFYQKGILGDFLYWNFKFPLVATSIPGYRLLPDIRQATIVGLLLLIPFLNYKKMSFEQKSVFFLALAAAFFAYPRFDYFHLVPQIALISLLIPLVVINFAKARFLQKSLLVIALTILAGFSLKSYKNSFDRQTRFFEADLIHESAAMKIDIGNSNKMYMQNSPDQLLPILGLIPTKPWADDFPWYLEKNNLQEKIINQLAKEKPKYIIFQNYQSGSEISLGSYKPKKVSNFIDYNYHEKAIYGNLILKERNEN